MQTVSGIAPRSIRRLDFVLRKRIGRDSMKRGVSGSETASRRGFLPSFARTRMQEYKKCARLEAIYFGTRGHHIEDG